MFFLLLLQSFAPLVWIQYNVLNRHITLTTARREKFEEEKQQHASNKNPMLWNAVNKLMMMTTTVAPATERRRRRGHVQSDLRFGCRILRIAMLSTTIQSKWLHTYILIKVDLTNATSHEDSKHSSTIVCFFNGCNSCQTSYTSKLTHTHTHTHAPIEIMNQNK